MLDVSILHPWAPSYLHLKDGAAICYRENKKVDFYSVLAKDAGSRFVPFVMDSFGTMGSFADKFMQDLASYAKESFSYPYSSASALASLSVLLQKGNAEILAQGCLMARSALPVQS